MGIRLNIKNPEAVALARQMAAAEGITITQVVLDALRFQHQQVFGARQIADIKGEDFRPEGLGEDDSKLDIVTKM